MQEHVARSGVQRFAENLDLTRLPAGRGHAQIIGTLELIESVQA